MEVNKTKNFILKSKKIHGDAYDYSLVEYINCKKKVKIICKEHGIFEQTPDNHIRQRGCPMCDVSKKSNTNFFIIKSEKVHGNKYDYSLVSYTDSKKKG